MKCKKCGGVAVINMRQHRLGLCEEHFLEWVPQQTQRFIEKYEMFKPQDRVLVAVSGGKDSLSLWDILLRLGYQADGLYIGLGIDGGVDYSNESYAKVRQFVDGWPAPLNLHVVDVGALYGTGVPQAAAVTVRGRGKPCAVCGMIKRYIMNRTAFDHGYDVIATGHNLDDEAAVLFLNTLHWQAGYLARQAPVLPADRAGLARKVKPLCRFYEREMAAYALVRGIDYIYEECPYAEGSNTIYYKGVLNRMEEEQPGAKLQFYLQFLEARAAGLFAGVQQAERDELHPCARCGQPTSAPDTCSFCRLWDRVAEHKAAGRELRPLPIR
jgi:uncharacterized protein (TIGR00269 family)